MTADLNTRIILVGQEQMDQAERLTELRHTVATLVRDVRNVEQEIATLKAAWVASRMEGAECSTSISS